MLCMLFQPTWELVKSHRDPRSVLSMQSMQIATPTGRKPVAAACFARSACCFGPNGNRTCSGSSPGPPAAVHRGPGTEFLPPPWRAPPFAVNLRPGSQPPARLTIAMPPVVTPSDNPARSACSTCSGGPIPEEVRFPFGPKQRAERAKHAAATGFRPVGVAICMLCTLSTLLGSL